MFSEGVMLAEKLKVSTSRLYEISLNAADASFVVKLLQELS
jgi:hypothetical protein